MEDTIELILQTALAQNLNIGSVLELRPLMLNNNPVIRNNLQMAFQQLEADGIFENVNDLLRLTENGFIHLHGSVENQLEYTKRQIIELAIAQNLNIGSVLELRPLMLNNDPVIKNNLQMAFQQLETDGIFENVNDLPCLTENGFRQIWNL